MPKRRRCAKVPGGSIKDGELEEEKGRLIWSFDISTPGSKNITELAVDAKTGEVASGGRGKRPSTGQGKAEDARRNKRGRTMTRKKKGRA